MRSLLVGIATLSLLALAPGCGDDGYTVPDSGPPLLDRCPAASDMAIIEAWRTDSGVVDGGPVPNPIIEAYDCSLTPTCVELYFAEQIEEARACVNDCMDPGPSGGLSSECRDCFIIEAVNCAGEYCFNECVGGNQASCTACFDGVCEERLAACIGY